MKTLAPALALAATMALAQPAFGQAPAYHDLAAIDRAVAGFAGAPAGEAGGALQPVDRRLRLAACRSDIALAWRGARRDSVVVQCPDAGGWRIFVPVDSAGSVSAAPAVARGDAVTISVSGEGFAVSQPGEAMEAGAVGAWIRVRTMQAGRTQGEPMRARVIRPGVVGVPLP